MKKLIIVLVIATALCMVLHDVTAATPEEFVRNDLVPFLESNDLAATLFAADLNISNGNPFGRYFGERMMFGCLVYVDDIMCAINRNNGDLALALAEYGTDVDTIRNEAIRLLLDPSLSPWGEPDGKLGCTTLEYKTFSDVLYLDYETGEWEHWPGEILGLRVVHQTEYMGGTRYRIIAAEGEIKFSLLWVQWRK